MQLFHTACEASSEDEDDATSTSNTDQLSDHGDLLSEEELDEWDWELWVDEAQQAPWWGRGWLYFACTTRDLSIQSWRSRGLGQRQRQAGALPSCLSFKVFYEDVRNGLCNFVNSTKGEWGSAPFLPPPLFLWSDGTYLLFCDLITMFLNVINAYVGVASPKTLSSCIQQFLL